ncbi:uncharacterized protein EAF01_009772 [Botrytis porri]|uniref:uncharacterized protein n=1 Tax=Botrytis porri TaxID=87229 RepID=UPI001901067A|nr:uncharacterized protein EAF01_009772 [Botrytis porri]KAF7895810.1 hypothetical protein EAF01_009772 [Botrytis porri]
MQIDYDLEGIGEVWSDVTIYHHLQDLFEPLKLLERRKQASRSLVARRMPTFCLPKGLEIKTTIIHQRFLW